MTPIQIKVLEALRSGKYKQTFGGLRMGDCFCAQGVVADVLLQEGALSGCWVMRSSSNDLGMLQLTAGMRYLGGASPALASVPELGLTRMVASHLVYLNDDCRYTFEQIARFLERFWKELDNDTSTD